MDIDNIV